MLSSTDLLLRKSRGDTASVTVAAVQYVLLLQAAAAAAAAAEPRKACRNFKYARFASCLGLTVAFDMLTMPGVETETTDCWCSIKRKLQQR